MKLLILLLVVKKVLPFDLTNGKIPGGWTFQDLMNHLHQKGYNGGYNMPGDTRRFDLGSQQAYTQQQQQQQPYPGVPSDGRKQTCCPSGNCPNPCQSFLPYFPPVLQAPVIVPMATYFEKVNHDHPPIHKIKDIIKRDKKEYRRRKKHHKHRGWESSCDEYEHSTSSESSDTESSFHEDSSDLDYYFHKYG